MAENIKDIKSFRATKFGFIISGNYSGRSRIRVNVPRVALGLSDIKDKNQDKPLEESGGFALVFGLRVVLIRASS